jgi:hypothetical protein
LVLGSGIKHIIGRTNARKYLYYLHGSCFALWAFTGMMSGKPGDTFQFGFGKLKDIRLGFE